MSFDVKCCRLCPRRCGADRTKSRGYCGTGDKMIIARAARHMWEEPPISGVNGSGTVFFAGCPLHCIYCQNKEISGNDLIGKAVSCNELADIMKRLEAEGAHNINLVTPTHYAPFISEAMLKAKETLGIPVVCNTGGYESPETLGFFDEFTNIYLPDFKYSDRTLAKRLSNAEDYPEVALRAVRHMADAVGKPVFDENGIMKSGVIIRHLVLPGERKNSIGVIKLLHENFSPDEIKISLMSQYTPISGMEGSLARRVTSFEYQSVLEEIEKYGFDGYIQSRDSATESYRPKFDLR